MKLALFWAMGEPNNYKNLGETVAKLRCDGAWNDVAPETKLAVVCTREIDITSNKEMNSIDYQPTVWRGLVDQKKCRGISPYTITSHFATRSLLPYDPYEAPACLNKTLKIEYDKSLESPIEANCIFYPRPRSYDCYDWGSQRLEEDLNMARSVAITQVSESARQNTPEIPMKLTPQMMFAYHSALQQTNHSNEPLTTTRFLPCIAQHQQGFIRMRLAVTSSNPDVRLDEVAVIAVVRAVQGCLTYPATPQRKYLLKHFVDELSKSCSVPNTFRVLDRIVNIFAPETVDPEIENRYISRMMDIILFKLGGGAWKDQQSRLDASRLHLSQSQGKLSLSLTPAADLMEGDKRKLLAYFSRRTILVRTLF